MLIVCNGAYKSGSTWVEKIVRLLVDSNDFPKKFRDKFVDRCLDISRLNDFLDASIDGNFVTKAHVSNPCLILSANKSKRIPKVIMIYRDPRDVLVSYYFHVKNVTGISLSMSLFYNILGRFKLCEIARYNGRWKALSNPNVLWIDYESMIASIHAQIDVIAEFLGVELTDAKRKLIIHETSLKQLKSKSHNPEFFRKGEVGDWVNYINSGLSRKLMLEHNNFPLWVKVFSVIIFDFRRITIRNFTFFRGV